MKEEKVYLERADGMLSVLLIQASMHCHCLNATGDQLLQNIIHISCSLSKYQHL